MKAKAHLRDSPLPAVIKGLSDDSVTGCLRVEFQPDAALFFFKEGSLVDARLADLRGISAVHVAISRRDAGYSFDGEVVPPEPAFRNESERQLLTHVLKVPVASQDSAAPARAVQQAMPEAQTREIVKTAETAALSAEALERTLPKNTNAESLEETVPLAEPVPAESIPTSSTSEAAGQPINSEILPEYLLRRQPVARLLQSFRRALATTHRRLIVSHSGSKFLLRQQLLRVTAAMLVIAVPAAVGLTMRLTKKNAEPETAPVVQTLPLRQSTVPSQVSTKESINENKTLGETPAPTSGRLEASHTLASEKNLKPALKEISSAQKPEGPADSDVPTTKNVEADRPAAGSTATSRTIMVVVRVSEGRVAEAWVKDSRKGSEAYEATAVRLVRQRHYSKDTSRTETVPVVVTMNR